MCYLAIFQILEILILKKKIRLLSRRFEKKKSKYSGFFKWTKSYTNVFVLVTEFVKNTDELLKLILDQNTSKLKGKVSK
jgi:hypothetical protein